jgi:hypothetical protein
VPSGMPDTNIRTATWADVPALQDLIGESLMRLQAEDYNEAQRMGAPGIDFWVDPVLIEDSTYLVQSGRRGSWRAADGASPAHPSVATALRRETTGCSTPGMTRRASAHDSATPISRGAA